MARTLSEITRRARYSAAIAGILFAAQLLRAEERTSQSAPPAMIKNPFAAEHAKPIKVVEKPGPARHLEASYRNPFSSRSQAPPIDSSFLLGPMSRWQPGAAPLDEPLSIKSAILSAEPINDIHIPWNQLPPVAKLQNRRSAHPGRAKTPAASDTDPPDPIQFATTPLAQPAWLVEEAQPAQPMSLIGQASFDQRMHGNRSGAWASGPAAVPGPHADVSPLIVTDIDNSSDVWLAQAQQAAGAAQSLDDMSLVAGLCDRGLRGTPTAEISASLRELAAWAHNRRGELLVDDDRQKEAIEEFQLAIALDANCSLAIHNRAVTFAQNDQLDAALRDFNRVIELNPGLAIAYQNRAELLATLDRMEEAIADYDRAIDSRPSDAELYAARAYAWGRLGHRDRAREDLNRALEIAPRHADLWTQRGNLSADCGEFGRAMADFERAISVDPDRAEAYRSKAWLLATCADERYRDAELALSAARNAVKRSEPGDYIVLESLAAAYAIAGQFDEAARIQKQALATAPADLRPQLRERLELYQANKPFRTAVRVPHSGGD